MTDEEIMRRALVLARKGEGRVEPNPMVGCVMVRDGRMIGEGYHRRFGAPHAEIEALRACTRDPRGATVYVSLEPCCHQGKTPACTDALIQAGVARVVLPMRDPNPSVNGRGIQQLLAAGITVDTGILRSEAAAVLAPFLTRTRLGRPYVIAKWAQSLDGQLVTPQGESRWISCESSRRRVHRLRSRVDAVLVGARTIVADDPLLTAREAPLRRQAIRVVLDGRLAIPESCRLVRTATRTPTLVFTQAVQVKTPKARRLVQRGVEVIACRSKRGRLLLPDCLHALADRGVTNLLVEGGPSVLSAFFDARLVDEAYVFVAPRFMGRTRGVETCTVPRTVSTRRSGSDLLYHMRFSDPPVAGE